MDGAVRQLQDGLTRSAARAGERVALVCGTQRVTYREIEERSNTLANLLVMRGIGRGVRVSVFADNTVETVISF